ncbi:hypothetical protein GALL_430650 [mine drainage metagenome]|uniref:Uncharacterized protein n=1 Tax=mine drainage metagenome TaxID=410659 RepID=A0A1J5QCQ5_9ZZZZ
MPQCLQRAVVECAHHDRHMRRVLAHQVEDAQRRLRFGVGDDHGAGALQTRRLQGGQAGRVTVHHILPRRLGLRHAVGVEVEGDVRDVLGVEQARQVLPAAPEAADDDVVLRLDGAARDIGELQRRQHPVRRRDLEHDAVDVLPQQGGVEHADHHGREHRVEHLGGNQAVAGGHREQHDAEFARRRQPERHAQAQSRRGLAQPFDAEDQRGLEQRRQQRQQEHQPPLCQHQPPVEQHADGDEKQPEEHIAERADVGFHL